MPAARRTHGHADERICGAQARAGRDADQAAAGAAAVRAAGGGAHGHERAGGPAAAGDGRAAAAGGGVGARGLVAGPRGRRRETARCARACAPARESSPWPRGAQRTRGGAGRSPAGCPARRRTSRRSASRPATRKRLRTPSGGKAVSGRPSARLSARPPAGPPHRHACARLTVCVRAAAELREYAQDLESRLSSVSLQLSAKQADNLRYAHRRAPPSCVLALLTLVLHAVDFGGSSRSCKSGSTVTPPSSRWPCEHACSTRVG
jgi:hypothetical protein